MIELPPGRYVIGRAEQDVRGITVDGEFLVEIFLIDINGEFWLLERDPEYKRIFTACTEFNYRSGNWYFIDGNVGRRDAEYHIMRYRKPGKNLN